MKIFAALIVAGALLAACAETGAVGPASEAAPAAVVADLQRDASHPATNTQLLISSHGSEMNALFLLASGDGPKPTLLLLHGLPGNERNFDLAQAIRRAGWNVLTFTYRGAWGSQGEFSISNAVDDARVALDFLRSQEAVQNFRVDRTRIVVAGHSMGGFAAAMTGAADKELAGVVLIDAWNVGAAAEQIRAAGAAGRAAFIAELYDIGRALQGATADSLADEVINSAGWDLLSISPGLASKPLLTVYATAGLAAENRALSQAVRRQSGSRVQAIEIDSDHSFADRRIALAASVVRWLEALDTAKP